MRSLTIEFDHAGRASFDVIDEYGQRTGRLTLGEMLEQVIGITIERRVHFTMLTEEGWAEREREAERRRQARERQRQLDNQPF